MTKPAIAHILKEIGFFLRLKGENPYKARAYERAGESLLMCDEPLHSLVQKEMLTRVTGIGAVTAEVITELWQTGASTLHQSAKGAYPSSLVQLGEVPGLTTKQIRRLYDRAGIRSVSDLHDACRTNRLLTVKGIGTRIQAKLLASLEEFQRGQGYRLF